MARTKTFERDVALATAIETFATFGYEGTSTEVLIQRMGISRQSMYDTFGDKHHLYLEALQRYCFENLSMVAAALQSGKSPLAAIEKALLIFSSYGCLAVGSIGEFGLRDRDVTAIADAAGASLRTILEAAVQRARDAGEIASDVDPKEAALFLSTVFMGSKIAVRGGAKPEMLASVVRTSLRSLK